MYQKASDERVTEAIIFMNAFAVVGFGAGGLAGLSLGALIGLTLEWVGNDPASFRRIFLNVYTMHLALMLGAVGYGTLLQTAQ
jgi:hypothetical protein